MLIKSLSIIFPFYNESRRLKNLFKDIKKFEEKKLVKKIEYIFVDDGSNDNSSKLILSYLQNNKIFNYKIIKYKTNRGKGYAIKKGILKANNQWILTVDLDISVSLLQINDWIRNKNINKNKSIYFGSRNLKESKIVFKIHRKILGAFFSLILKLLFNINLKDTQCGFKLYKNIEAKRIFKTIKDTGFVHDVEVVLLSKKFGYKIDELPVKWIHRNESKLNILIDSFKMFLKLFVIKKNLFSYYS